MSKFINRFLTVVTIIAMVVTAIIAVVLIGSIVSAISSQINTAMPAGGATTGGSNTAIMYGFVGFMVVIVLMVEGALLGSIFIRRAIFKKIQARREARKLQESKQNA